MRLAPAIPRRLDDEMKVRRLPSAMRPRTDIDLLRLGNGLHGLRDPLQERGDFPSLCRREVADGKAVAERLDDECAGAQRAGAVLDHPMLRGVNSPARERFGALGQPTGVAV